MKRLDAYWYDGGRWMVALAPLSWLFAGVVALRRYAYRVGWRRVTRLPVPVIVVGNITAGGTGKTPLVIWLAQWLRDAGFRPAIVCRGYRGRATRWPQIVTAASDARLVGDEAVLMARRSRCVVVAGPDRVTAAQTAVAEGCNILVSDDGLQHYALARDIEITVIDGARRYGNGRLLPAGPLREPVSRLATVDFVVTNGEARDTEYRMAVSGDTFHRIGDDMTCDAASLRGRPLHAVAGIGNPQRFFDALTATGLEFTAHVFPDHHHYDPGELRFGDDATVVMTEKDAVKFPPGLTGDYWYLPVAAHLDPRFVRALSQRLDSLKQKD